MGLAHADSAIKEQRVIGFGRTLGDSLARGVSKLITGADDECVESIAGVQLRCAIPIKAGLRRCCGDRNRGETAVVADRGRGGIVLRGDEFYVVKFEAQIIDGLLDKIGILVALAPELWRRHSNE